jgi:hypothetical protein
LLISKKCLPVKFNTSAACLQKVGDAFRFGRSALFRKLLVEVFRLAMTFFYVLARTAHTNYSIFILGLFFPTRHSILIPPQVRLASCPPPQAGRIINRARIFRFFHEFFIGPELEATPSHSLRTEIRLLSLSRSSPQLAGQPDPSPAPDLTSSSSIRPHRQRRHRRQRRCFNTPATLHANTQTRRHACMHAAISAYNATPRAIDRRRPLSTPTHILRSFISRSSPCRRLIFPRLAVAAVLYSSRSYFISRFTFDVPLPAPYISLARPTRAQLARSFRIPLSSSLPNHPLPPTLHTSSSSFSLRLSLLRSLTPPPSPASRLLDFSTSRLRETNYSPEIASFFLFCLFWSRLGSQRSRAFTPHSSS